MRRFPLVRPVRESLPDKEIQLLSDWESSGRRFKSCQAGQSFRRSQLYRWAQASVYDAGASRDAGCPMNVAVAKSCDCFCARVGLHEHLDGLATDQYLHVVGVEVLQAEVRPT